MTNINRSESEYAKIIPIQKDFYLTRINNSYFARVANTKNMRFLRLLDFYHRDTIKEIFLTLNS